MTKNFASLGIALSREEAKEVVGGRVVTSCSCRGSVGSWTYTSGKLIPASVLEADVIAYCPGGNGTCSATEILEI